MISLLPHIACVSLACLPLTQATPQVTADPTQASDLITAKLNSQTIRPRPAAATIAKLPSNLPEYQIKAMLVRDADHATALITSSSGDKIMVPLERIGQTVKPFKISCGGLEFELVDFTATSIRFRSMELGLTIVAH